LCIWFIGVDWHRSYIMNTFRVTLDDLDSIWKTLAIARCRYRFRRRWVVERSRVSDTCFTSLSLELMLRLDNLRPGGTLRWKVEDRQLERSGCVMWQVGTSKDVAPRLCRLRTDGLAPASKYWTYRSHTRDMGPVSLVASC
jgi:hypothetical protein